MGTLLLPPRREKCIGQRNIPRVMQYHKLTPSPTRMRQTTGTTIARIFTVAGLRCNHEARDFGWPLASAEMKQKETFFN